MTLATAIAHTGELIDALGVAVIVLGLVVAAIRFVARGFARADDLRTFRQDLGRGILLGLEILIAADIIRTVAITPTLDDVLVLGLIRTFLSLSLQVEIDGRWPWQGRATVFKIKCFYIYFI